MKGKALLCIAIVLSMALALLPMLVMASPAYMEVVFQDTGTNEYIIENFVPPVTFNVDLVIHDVTDMWGWSTTVAWNKDVLNCTGVTVGPFNPSGTFLLAPIDNEVGEIPEMAASTLVEDSVTGFGVVCTLEFLAHDAGTSLIDLSATKYIDLTTKTVTPVDPVDGLFEARPYVGPPRAPVATFTPVTCTQFRLDKNTLDVTVYFDASASEGSYDSLPDPGTENPIMSYAWDFDNDGVPDYSSNVPTASWTYDETYPGTAVDAPVTLEIYAPDQDPSETHPDFEDTDYVTNTIHILPPVVGADIDVYTEKPDPYSGKGKGCDKTTGEEYVAATEYKVTLSVENIEDYYDPDATDFLGWSCRVEWDPTELVFTGYEKGPFPPVEESQYILGDTPSEPGVMPCLAFGVLIQMPKEDVTGGGDIAYLYFMAKTREYPTVTITESLIAGVYYVMGVPKIREVPYTPEFAASYEYTEPPLWSAMSDAFGPQEEVTVYALVTYNEEPVENKLVAFEIRDPEGNVVAWRSAATDSAGIATVSFRIPWTGATAEELFGAWLLTATVSIAEESVMDKCRFRFGYLVSIVGITAEPPSLYKGNDLGVTVTLANIAFTPQDGVLTVVLYDECGVPINYFGASLTVDPVSMEAPLITLSIPSWAYVGIGTAYVNIFDDWPSAGGTPMCAEGSTGFVILNTP